MEEDVMIWIFTCGMIAAFFTWVIIDRISMSLDDGWLGDFVEKRRQKKVESEAPVEPPFPLDKPNSCQYCKHNLCTGLSYVCDAYDGRIETWWWSRGRTGFRTWDRCDDYEPLRICTNCKYDPAEDVITETHIIGDEEVEVKIFPPCQYKSECKHAEKWELKERK